jgi:cation transport ATPase
MKFLIFVISILIIKINCENNEKIIKLESEIEKLKKDKEIQMAEILQELKAHIQKDQILHNNIENEDKKDDNEMLNLKKINQKLKQKIKRMKNKLNNHQKKDEEIHKEINFHISSENSTFFFKLIKSLATILTGVGLGSFINLPFNFYGFFENRFVRFFMIVILAWQGGLFFLKIRWKF